MFSDYTEKKGVDLLAWVAQWEQLGVAPSTATGSARAARSAVNLEALATAKAKAAQEAKQRRLAFLESVAASTERVREREAERVNDWVHASPTPRADEQRRSLRALASGDIEAIELLDDLQAAAEEVNLQRQDEVDHRQLIGARAAFARADVGGDGVVSSEDFIAWLASELVVPDAAGFGDRRRILKQWQARFGAAIMEAPAVGSSGTVGVALEGFSKLRARRLKELEEELEQARKRIEGARKQNRSLQERTARARALSSVSEHPPAQVSSVQTTDAADSVDASNSEDPPHCVISELKRLERETATLHSQNAIMLETLQVIEQLSPQLSDRTRRSKQDLEPEPEAALDGQENIPQLKMLPAQAHMMAHFELMLAEHSLDPAWSHDIKGHVREHARKVANMLSPWQPIPSAFDVERTAVGHMDMHRKQCLDENAYATLSSSAVRELQEHLFAHALQIAKAARRVPRAVTTIVVRFEQPGPIGLALSSEHPFDAAWEQADAKGDGKLSRRELLHVLGVMGRFDNLDESAIGRYTTQVMNELDPKGYGMIDKPQFQRWYEAQQNLEPARVRVERCDVVAARQGLQRGFYVLSVNAADVRNKTVQEVTDLVRAAGRPLTIEFGLPDGAHLPPVTPRRLRAALAEAAPRSFKLALQMPSKPKLRTTTLLFGKDQDLGLVLASDDPLDQVWTGCSHCGSQIDQSGVGVVGRNEISELLRKMGRDVSAQAVTTAMIEMTTGAALRRMGQDTILQEGMTATSETETGAYSSHEIEIEDLENWYNRQSDRKMNAVYVDSAGEYAASRGLHTGARIMSIQGVDMRKTPLRLVLQAIKAGRDSVKAGKPMRMVIERVGSDRATSLPAKPPSPVEPKSPSSPQAQLPSPVQAGSASSPQAEVPPSGRLMTVVLKKDRTQQGSSLGSYGMTLSPKLKVLSLPQTVSGKKTKTGPAEKAGVQVGMVLVSINGEGVTSLTDVASKCSAAHGAGLKCTFRQPPPALSSRPPSPLRIRDDVRADMKDANCTVHVGGLDTYLPPKDESLKEHTKRTCEAELRQLFKRFGNIRSCNVRLRREIENVGGVQQVKVSWALISFFLPAEAQFAVREYKSLQVQEWPNLVVKMIDGRVPSSMGGLEKMVAENVYGRHLDLP